MKKLSLYLAILISVLAVGAWFLVIQDNDRAGEKGNGQIDTSSWIIYENTQYGFKIMHPSDWTVFEDPDNEIQPAFNFIPPGYAVPQRALIHHSFEPNVSVFPQGVPTEGIFAPHRPSNINFSEEPRVAIDFLLENGDAWATYANYPAGPDSWMESGFIWSRADIENYSSVCLRGDKEIPDNQCDLLGGGDELTHRGEVNQEMRQIQELVLGSFEFLSQGSQ